MNERERQGRNVRGAFSMPERCGTPDHPQELKFYEEIYGNPCRTGGLQTISIDIHPHREEIGVCAGLWPRISAQSRLNW